MKKVSFILATVAALSLVAGEASAAIIVQYDAANNGVTSMAPVVVAGQVSGDNMTAGAGISTASGSTWNFTGWDTDNTSFALAVADDEQWKWGFDVTSGNISLTTMDIRLDRSGTGPDDFEIQVSVNGGAATSLLTYDFNDGSVGVDFLGVDISSVSGLTAGDSVVFTLAAYNSESTAGTFDLENITFPGGNNGIVINGTIPEPAALVLLGSLAMGIVAMRKRLG